MTSGCGDDDTPAETPAGSGGSGGMSGQGGAGQGGSSGQGGSAGQGGGAAGQGGGAGASGGGSGGSGGSGSALCRPDKATVSGTLGATTINKSYLGTGGYEAPYGSSDDLVLSVGEEGRAYLLPPMPPPEGVAVEVSGLLQLPADGAGPRTFVCAGEGSSLTIFGDDGPLYSAHLASLSQLGACPGGAPVSGEVTVTLGDGGSAPPKIVSTVEGAAFTAPIAKASLLGHDGKAGIVTEVFTAARQGVAFFAFDEAETAPLDEGAYFVVPAGSPDAGAVYCAGEGSTATTTGSGPDVVIESVTLRNVTRLGACPGTPAAGSLDICLTPVGGTQPGRRLSGKF